MTDGCLPWRGERLIGESDSPSGPKQPLEQGEPCPKNYPNRFLAFSERPCFAQMKNQLHCWPSRSLNRVDLVELRRAGYRLRTVDRGAGIWLQEDPRKKRPGKPRGYRWGETPAAASRNHLTTLTLRRDRVGRKARWQDGGRGTGGREKALGADCRSAAGGGYGLARTCLRAGGRSVPWSQARAALLSSLSQVCAMDSMWAWRSSALRICPTSAAASAGAWPAV
ncbi:MAG: hypothetical protein RJA22_282 [Verrucomicrobiota bacterium]